MKTTKTDISKVGRRGAVVIPALLRRPSIALPIERYTPQRRAEFLLSNAVSEKDYARATEEVRKMGLDPAGITHYKGGRRKKRKL
jgi:hypothetical protein